MQQIILRDLRRPCRAEVRNDIEWLGDSLGFQDGRREMITTQILHGVLHDVASNGSTSTERISNDLDLAAQRVNYHLRSLVESGFLYREKRLIFVRQGSVKAAVEEMRRDANRIFDNVSAIAEEIDAMLGFQNRR